MMSLVRNTFSADGFEGGALGDEANQGLEFVGLGGVVADVVASHCAIGGVCGGNEQDGMNAGAHVGGGFALAELVNL